MSEQPWLMRAAPEIEPPVYVWQYSYRPSKTGQSAPRLKRSRCEADVVVAVEGGHVRARRELRPEHVDVLIQAIVDNELVSHPHAVRPHRVALPVVEVADLSVVEVVDARPAR
eukprot:scaffold1238_cov116-Isochrysis_galbana.AAC.3